MMSNDEVRAIESAMEHLDQAVQECEACTKMLTDNRKYVGGFVHALGLIKRSSDALSDIRNVLIEQCEGG